MTNLRWLMVAAGAVALAALLALVAAAPAAAQPGPMHEQPAGQHDGADFDRAWLQEMVMHHAMAVMMARPVAERAEHLELQGLARAIVDDQMREIAAMRGWLKDWYGIDMPDPLAVMEQMHAGGMPPGGTLPGMMHGAAGMPAIGGGPMTAGPMADAGMMDMGMMMDMMDDYATLPARRLEVVFMSLMIGHHEGAVAMAQEAVEQASHPEVRDLADQIIASQSAEIDQMNIWLNDWYGL